MYYMLEEKKKGGATTKQERNLVHKHARKFNRSEVHRDRKNDYKRQKSQSWRKWVDEN